MWWRFIIFCFLVSFILFVVLNYLHDRPVVHFKFFKRDPDEQIVFEKFKDNFLKERLVAFEFEADNGTFVPEDVDIEEVIEVMRAKLNVHDPDSRRIVECIEKVLVVTEKNEILEESKEWKSIELDEDITDDILDKNEAIDIEKDEIEAVKHNMKDLNVSLGNKSGGLYTKVSDEKNFTLTR